MYQFDIGIFFRFRPRSFQSLLVAATLCQFNPSSKLCVPIAFFSRKLNKAQFKYAIFDNKVLAIYETCKFFKYLLDGRHFTALCDKKNSKHFTIRILRQLQYIFQFSKIVI